MLNRQELIDWYQTSFLDWKPIYWLRVRWWKMRDWFLIQLKNYEQCWNCGIVLDHFGISSEGMCHTCDGLNYMPY